MKNNQRLMGMACIVGFGVIAASGEDVIDVTVTPPDTFTGLRADYLQIGNSGESIGFGSAAIGQDSVASGFGALASGNSRAYGDYSIALGNGNFAVGAGTQIFGQFAKLGIAADSSADGYDQTEPHPLNYLFVIGNGTNPVERSNAFVVYRNGDAEIMGSLTSNGSRVITEFELQFNGPDIRTALRNNFENESLAWGVNNTINSNNLATAWGKNNRATGEQATAWGTSTNAKGFGATAWGTGSQSKNTDTTAWGNQAKALGWTSTAWGISTTAGGRGSTVWGDRSMSIGLQTTSWGLETIAAGKSATSWGEKANATGDHSTAWGLETSAIGARSTTFGNGTITSSDDSLAIGRFNEDSVDGLLVVGNGNDADNRSNSLVVSTGGQTTLTNKAWSERPGNIGSLVDPAPADASENGEALLVEGHTRFAGRVVLEQAQGDIPMGIFGQ